MSRIVLRFAQFWYDSGTVSNLARRRAWPPAKGSRRREESPLIAGVCASRAGLCVSVPVVPYVVRAPSPRVFIIGAVRAVENRPNVEKIVDMGFS